MTRKTYYWDKLTETFIEGYPPQPEKYGQAPYVIGDTISPYYHPKIGIWVDSKRALENIDKATGCITTDKMQPAFQSKNLQQEDKEIKEDIHRAVRATIESIDSGQRQFSEDERAYHTENNQALSQKFGFDAFNVAGKKNDPRGKRYRKPKF